MKIIKINKYLGFIYLAGLIFSVACTENELDSTKPDIETPDTNVFAKGADISWATKMESEGEEFFSTSGERMECTKLMKEIGMNSVRYRVWVNPVDGWNSKADVLSKALIASKLGMRIMIDFHYSDTWADPGNQNPPAAWAGYNLEEMKDAVADHTIDVLSTLKSQGIDVEWVQVGNETPVGMLLPIGLIDYNNSNFAELVNSGYDAVKSVYPEALVIVHVDKGNDKGRQEYVFDYLTSKNAKYDLMGVSIYPEPNNWEIYAAKSIENIKTLGDKYGKPTMICEVGMSHDQVEMSYNFLSYLIDNAKNQKDGFCKGVFYWEPQAPAGYNGGYTKGAFAKGRPTKALDAFK